MSDSDEEWVPKKTQVKRKSIAPNARRVSAAPKIVISLYSDGNSEKQTKEDPKSSKRLSILPKKSSALKSDSSSHYNVPDHLLSTANSLNRRKSIAPKVVSNSASDIESVSVEKSLKLLQKRKSVAPGPMPNTENEVNPKPSNRRKSVIPKPFSNKCTDELKENDPSQKVMLDTIKSNSEGNNITSSDKDLDNKASDPTSRKRKSVAPKTASNVSKPLMQHEEKNPPHKRKSVAFKGVPSVYPLQDERNKFEEDIKSYSGEDPLSVWYKYFKWVEQNFLRGGKDGQIVPLMQRCLRTLGSQKQYCNDKRLIEIWLKFATEAKDPVKVYNHMFNHKIGCEFAKLFIDWSSQLELEGNLIQANEILKKGIDCQAEPMVELKSYWSKLKARTCVVSDSQEPKKPQPKNIQLVTEPKKPKVQEEQPMAKDILRKLPCVDDMNANPASRNQNSCLPNEHFRYYRQSVYMNPRMSVLPTESKIPDGEQEPNDPPVALFEPPDPTKIPMYDKNKIYAWSGEVSFEEIRAADWFRREKTINLELRVSDQESIIAKQAQKIKLLEEKIENLQMCLKIQFNSQQSSAEYPTFNKSQVPEPLLVNTPSTASDTNSQPCPSGASYDSSKDHKNAATETRSNCQDTLMQNNLDGKAVSPTSIPKPIAETGNFTCVDPFDSQVNSKFLQSLNLPLDYYGSFFASKERISLDLKRKDLIRVGDISYLIEDMISEGSYGKVFVAVEQPPNSSASKSKVAIKVSKHVTNWEIYMCVTLHSRLGKLKDPPNVQLSVMKVNSAHKYTNAIIFTNELSLKGTLLDMVNSYKINKSHVPELLAMYITWELLQIVSKMHKCQIIHADIKPDNVLIRDDVSIRDIVDSLSLNTALVKLIDFGRAIDLTFFEKGVCFSSTFKKDKCVEMIEKKPWVFQIDWFGLLNCVHVLLFADYIKVRLQANGRWFIEKKLQRRWDQTIWTPLFDELLNIPTCYQEPNIESHCNRIMSKLQQNIKDFKY